MLAFIGNRVRLIIDSSDKIFGRRSVAIPDTDKLTEAQPSQANDRQWLEMRHYFLLLNASVSLKAVVQDQMWGEETKAVPTGPPQNRNRIHEFYSNICFSKITKSQCIFPVILRNKKDNYHNLNLMPRGHQNSKSDSVVTVPWFEEPLQLIQRRKIDYHSYFSLSSTICFPMSLHTELWHWKYAYPKLL
jgi:hypothetical protein